ncbi:putative iron sulfur assembly protein 1 [Erysiphe neolycopersici]|uniref:Iron-sulfur assembly protein 1 n=1 Tax=Erysiphe neolycopersici TaxID=212602 RepID=A0A420HXW1_9PEZI|nr:putative iron sulfur assembly protein 1 [Erysiphe neolycopersici]
MASFKAFPMQVSSSAMRIKYTTIAKHSRPLGKHVLRNFTIGTPSKSSLKRKIQTSTGWQPHSFNFEPPPTLVSAIPKTATGGITERYNDLISPEQVGKYDIGTEALRTVKPTVNSLEESVKKPINTINNSTLPEAKQRQKLRARKAAIKLTPSAVNHLRKLLDQPSPKLIKIGIRNRGCSGSAYHLEYVDKAGLLDEEIAQDGVKVIIDSKALFSIIGSEMDWVEDKLQQKFVFKNPNIKEQCGCGESFMV